jgi:AbrB family looped-hinge helix DNA binding protein
MEKYTAVDVILRPKRQITLPSGICQRLGIVPGDKLELVVEGNTLIARPQKAIALEALREIREAFKRSGITEGTLQEVSRQIRQKSTGEHYAAKV